MPDDPDQLQSVPTDPSADQTPAQSTPQSQPDNFISRLTADTPGKSATLCEPLLGYIALRILYLGDPVKGLVVQVANENGDIQQTGERHRKYMGWKDATHMVTNDDGYCTLGKKVMIGSYTCHLDHQKSDAPITTVEDPKRPFVLVLPFGRPYCDLYLEPNAAGDLR